MSASPAELREAAAQHTWRADYHREQAEQHDRDAARLLREATDSERNES